MNKTQNNIADANAKATVMFIDMNSFFPSCEQQVNFWLRERPVGVCVYTGREGSVIALSKTAKKMGLKPARLSEIMKQCPEFVPLETNPNRYREFHRQIIKVLRQFSEDVIPFSIDEAVIDFRNYGLVYKDLKKTAVAIKEKIKKEVGDYFTCSIGIAPNEFLAKLGTELQKPDGLVMIDNSNIDAVLENLSLTDLPGISKNMAARLIMAGIQSPVQLRHTSPEMLRRACKSIVGEFWHYRLNFKEVDMVFNRDYKTMQAMRQISAEQRASGETLYDILNALCMQLEKRMITQEVYAKSIGFSIGYKDGKSWGDVLHTNHPIQGAEDLRIAITTQIKVVEEAHTGVQILNSDVTRMSVNVADFVQEGLHQYAMFDDSLRKNKLRKTVYNIRDKFGFEKIRTAAELLDKPVMKDVIGFGSIKDLSRDAYE